MGFQIAGILILAVFYGCYFTKMISQYRRGIKTDQIGKGKTGVVKTIEVTMKIATYLVPVFEVANIVRIQNSFAVPVRIAGVLIGITGVAVFITSVLTMQDSWRAGVSKTDKTALVTRGIYQISRNPAFLGFDLVYIGIAMMFFSWTLCAVSLFAMIMFHLQIVNVEEGFLIEAFGNEYVEYRKKVCRYLGRK